MHDRMRIKPVDRAPARSLWEGKIGPWENRTQRVAAPEAVWGRKGVGQVTWMLPPSSTATWSTGAAGGGASCSVLRQALDAEKGHNHWIKLSTIRMVDSLIQWLWPYSALELTLVLKPHLRRGLSDHLTTRTYVPDVESSRNNALTKMLIALICTGETLWNICYNQEGDKSTNWSGQLSLWVQHIQGGSSTDRLIMYVALARASFFEDLNVWQLLMPEWSDFLARL